MNVWLTLVLLLVTTVSCRNRPAPGPMAEGAVKIVVKQDGFYKVSRTALQETIPQLEILDPDRLHLSQAGVAIPYVVDGDSLIFYGQAPANRYTDVRPYILQFGQPGVVMGETAVSTQPAPILERVPQTLYREENLIYDSRAAGSIEGEPWFWQTIQVQSKVTIDFELPEPGNGSATLRIGLWGATYDNRLPYDHDFDLLVNGRYIETVRWKGSVYHISESALPPGTVQPGHNSITLDNSVEGATLIDIMKLDWIEINYQTMPTARQDRFYLSNVDGRVRVGNFSGRPFLFNIQDPTAPTLLTGWQFEADHLELTTGGAAQVAAIGPGGFLTPAVTGLRQSAWRDKNNQADLLIITTDELLPALDPLVAARQEQGLKVIVIPVAEIYDEFGFGEATPGSIQQFIQYVMSEWQTPSPRYLLLVGEATYDYRGYLGERPRNHIPAPLVPVTHGGETVSDTRLADATGDFRPDLAVGRWPVGDARTVTNLVKRTLAYEQGTAVEQAIFSADGTSAEFSTLANNLLLASQLPETQVKKMYGTTSAELVEEWNHGPWLVTYVGHGSLDRWGREDVFSSAAVGNLRATGAPPLVIQLTCLTGFFAHPTIPSLSEKMLTHNQGPVLLIAATSLTLSSSQAPFGISLLQELQNPDVERIGDALQRAKLSLNIDNDHSREVSDTFGLLGDPSTFIIRP